MRRRRLRTAVMVAKPDEKRLKVLVLCLERREEKRMPRAKGGAKTRQRRKKVLKKAKGYFGGRRKLYRSAAETVLRAGAFAYRDRRQKKRRARALWIVRINAACRVAGLSYSRFMNGLQKAG